MGDDDVVRAGFQHSKYVGIMDEMITRDSAERWLNERRTSEVKK
jgi:hypothetical protein